VAAAVAVVGCDKGSSGGPGTTNTGTDKKGMHMGQADDTFSLSVPTLATHIKQGESKVVDIGITRGKNFDQDVTLKLDGLPKGVTVDTAAPAIKHGEKDVKITLKAADDAALGDHSIKVTGHPAKGADAANEFKVTIEKK
jgi:uncharacterized membrane protein